MQKRDPRGLDLWKRSKHQEASTKKKIDKYKTQVEAFLVKARTTELITAKYKVQRQLQSKENISKQDVPANIWTQYAKTSLQALFFQGGQSEDDGCACCWCQVEGQSQGQVTLQQLTGRSPARSNRRPCIRKKECITHSTSSKQALGPVMHCA